MRDESHAGYQRSEDLKNPTRANISETDSASSILWFQSKVSTMPYCNGFENRLQIFPAERDGKIYGRLLLGTQ